ncbi:MULTISPECIES: cysteine synthase family protein [unclassified Tenacibaculum]|uniref:cysteine synthase family protein n=1 Tax=unclassified Tenacibaculum TaxID=2635139 RepID=UPI001F1EAA9B|nr:MULTISPECIES: PLP-dependent cysteine synthase family protein [unclassified Tenacibaculum]MCF2873167.1 PLP-dependent cysteine synthase family protein [Tenacibaculum sp. Cn5-1]MCF2933323.1 PLP-dependent cysteine synthase family protein [Tenacibaculum sp. Cn5-34]MCG7510096.1 PLP-dependent cysteine synthase family protein [Tenacibaculum sp. Cn5-46]
MKNSILDLVESSTFVRLKKFENINLDFKLEQYSITGSIKDKNAFYFILKAKQEGLLAEGGTIIESSSGNFGIALTVIGRQLGHPVKIVIDKKTSRSMKKILETYGADVLEIGEEHCDEVGSMQKARMAYAQKIQEKTPGSWYACQHLNPMTSEVHYHLTASEIEKEYKGAPDVIVVGVSTAGQLAGISRYFRENYPKTKIWGVDVKGSGIFTKDRHPYKMTGLGLSFTPPAFNWDLVDRAFCVDDELSFSFCYYLAKKEGLLLGASSGTVIAATLKALKTEENIKNVCMISADSGFRYLDTFYDEQWLKENDLQIFNEDQCFHKIDTVIEHKRS